MPSSRRTAGPVDSGEVPFKAAPSILLLRHGETDWNKAGRFQGQSDIPLNATGRAQARALVDAVRPRGIRSICSSDLVRARETAEIVAEGLGLTLAFTDPRLRERGYGLFEGLTREECERRLPHEWSAFANPLATPAGGEPLASVRARMVEAVLRIQRDCEGPVLVVSHGRAIRELATLWNGATQAPVGNAQLVPLVGPAPRSIDEPHAA